MGHREGHRALLHPGRLRQHEPSSQYNGSTRSWQQAAPHRRRHDCNEFHDSGQAHAGKLSCDLACCHVYCDSHSWLHPSENSLKPLAYLRTRRPEMDGATLEVDSIHVHTCASLSSEGDHAPECICSNGRLTHYCLCMICAWPRIVHCFTQKIFCIIFRFSLST